jgi:hypothetical protein
MGVLIQIPVLLGLACLTLAHHNTVGHSGNQEAINQIKKSIFTPEYNVNVRPYNEAYNGTTRVTVQFKNIRVLEVDEAHGKLTVQGVYRQKWVDPRLAYNSTLDINNIRIKECNSIMWLPDLYFENGLPSTSKFDKGTRYTGIGQKGGVFFSQRVTQTFFCPELYNKEAKEITCQSAIMSYGYYSDELQLQFSPQDPIVNDDRDTVSLEKYNYEGATASECTELLRGNLRHDSHEYPCLNLALKLSRK